jgi:hypothetical protein
MVNIKHLFECPEVDWLYCMEYLTAKVRRHTIGIKKSAASIDFLPRIHQRPEWTLFKKLFPGLKVLCGNFLNFQNRVVVVRATIKIF